MTLGVLLLFCLFLLRTRAQDGNKQPGSEDIEGGGDFFIVYVKSRDRQLGLYLRQGGYISGFTPLSELGHRQSGVRVGDRIASVNSHRIILDTSADDINDLILSASAPFVLVIAVDVSTSAARQPALLSGQDMLVEKELRHAQDVDNHHLGIGLDIDRYTRPGAGGGAGPPGINAGGVGTTDGNLVIKQNQSLTIFLSDGPLKMLEFPASAALFGTAIAPGQCVSRRLLHITSNPQACVASTSGPSGANTILLARRGACSFHHKALHAALMQADGLLIVNADETHFAAPSDPSLSSAPRGQQPRSIYAAMLSRSAGETAVAAYLDAAQRGAAVDVKVCIPHCPATVLTLTLTLPIPHCPATVLTLTLTLPIPHRPATVHNHNHKP